jgi:hypothetical protein
VVLGDAPPPTGHDTHADTEVTMGRGPPAGVSSSATVTSPELHLQTCLVLDHRGRITSTREPEAVRGPLFTLTRGELSCAWAIRDDVAADVADELDRLARDEPPTWDFRAPPRHAQRYIALLGARIAAGGLAETKTRQSDGPAFQFPEALPPSGAIVEVHDEETLQRHFRGWMPGEIAGGRSPALAIVDGGHPVSICFCARRSDVAAEAGLDTAEGYRGRGYAPRVTAAWARAIRASGLIPLYSTGWANKASLAVARKLGLVPYASSWGLSG